MKNINHEFTCKKVVASEADLYVNTHTLSVSPLNNCLMSIKFGTKIHHPICKIELAKQSGTSRTFGTGNFLIMKSLQS